MSYFLQHFWPHLTGIVAFVIELWAAGHAVLYKRDSRSTIGWVGLILLTPLVGAALYWMFGINRIQRRAKLMRSGETAAEPSAAEHAAPPELIEKHLHRDGQHFFRLIDLVTNAT